MRVLLGVALAGYVVGSAVLWHTDVAHRDLIWLGSSVVLFVVAVIALRRAGLTARTTTFLVLGVGALLQLVALTRAPLTSDDAARYLWDGKVQLAGVDPYRYAPTDPALRRLRDDFLFGPTSSCAHPIAGGCTAINRPTVHTLYPPVAQVAFALGRVLSFGGHGGLLAFQVLAALGVLLIGFLLVRLQRSRGAPVWPVALWAWCPLVVSEYGQNAHIDWLGVLFGVLALRYGAAGRDGRAGVALGAAIATKLYPALLLPSLARRRPWLVAGLSVAVVVVGYLPHLLAAGSQVVGYLPGYLQEEGYDSGSRLLLLGAVLPHPLDTVVGLAVLGATALWVWRHTDPAVPERTAVVMTGVGLLVATPSYGWYAGLLVALAVVSARYEWTVLALATTVVYLTRSDLTQWNVVGTVVYLVGALGTLAGWWLRTHRTAAGAPIPQTSSRTNAES